MGRFGKLMSQWTIAITLYGAGCVFIVLIAQVIEKTLKGTRRGCRGVQGMRRVPDILAMGCKRCGFISKNRAILGKNFE